MEKQDVTEYGSGELGLIFQNDEGLYQLWEDAVDDADWERITEYVEDNFIYNTAQLDELADDFDSEVEEN